MSARATAQQMQTQEDSYDGVIDRFNGRPRQIQLGIHALHSDAAALQGAVTDRVPHVERRVAVRVSECCSRALEDPTGSVKRQKILVMLKRLKMPRATVWPARPLLTSQASPARR